MSSGEQSDRLASGLRILLVEDEMLIAMMLEDMLTELGHEVVGPVARVSKAIEMARHGALDAAILDVNINGEEVYPVADELDARGIPFLFATGYDGTGLRERYCKWPALKKPFQWCDLKKLVSEVFPAKRG